MVPVTFMKQRTKDTLPVDIRVPYCYSLREALLNSQTTKKITWKEENY